LQPNVIEIHGEPYLNAAEACELLGVKPATLYAYVSRGVLKSYRQGIKRQRLYRRGDVQRVLHLRPSRGSHPLPHAADWVGDP
jgi:excisionase family DNA binding protein